MLKSKFPNASNGNLTEDEINKIRNFQNPAEYKNSISVDRLGSIIHKLKKMVSHGIDHFRNEHIRQLWNCKIGDIIQDEFRYAYTKHINRVINADISKDLINL